MYASKDGIGNGPFSCFLNPSNTALALIIGVSMNVEFDGGDINGPVGLDVGFEVLAGAGRRIVGGTSTLSFTKLSG